jgi:hypothetical protein
LLAKDCGFENSGGTFGGKLLLVAAETDDRTAEVRGKSSIGSKELGYKETGGDRRWCRPRSINEVDICAGCDGQRCGTGLTEAGGDLEDSAVLRGALRWRLQGEYCRSAHERGL